MIFFTNQPVVVTCALGSAAVACYTDLRSRCIPNWLTGAVVLLGLTVQTHNRGWEGSMDAVGGLLLCGAAFVVFYLGGGMGAGDVKLIAAEGCLLGAQRSPELLFATALAGGALAFVLAIKKHCLGRTLKNVVSLMEHHRQMGLTPHAELNLRSESALRLPYAIAIAGGVVLTILVQPSSSWFK